MIIMQYRDKLFLLLVQVQLLNGVQRFITEPSDATAFIGDTKILVCKVEDRQGEVQWTKDGFGLDVTRDLSGYPRYKMIGADSAGEYSLEISNIQIDDDAIYECQILATNVLPSMRSKSATINVLVPPNPPLILNGNALNTTEDTEISLECYSSGGRPEVKIRWLNQDNTTVENSNITDGSQTLPDGKRMTVTSVIRFNVTKANDNSDIICETSSDALDTPLRASITLNIKYAPVVTVTVEPAEIFEGDKVTFTCAATSNPAVKSYLWFSNNVPLIGSQTEKYEIESIGRAEHNVEVKCQVRNLEGKVGDASVKPKVNYKPIFTQTPSDVSDDKGVKVTLKCKADGFPKPTYIWYRNGNVNHVVGDKQSLDITIDESSIGKYYCRVSVTGFEEISTSAIIYMKGPPNILNKESQASQIGKEGDTAQLVCDSFAIPSPTKVTWYVDGKAVDGASAKYGVDQTAKADGVVSTLSVKKSTHDDFTEYKCDIENSYGTDSATFTLVKEVVPSIILPVIVGTLLGAVLLMSASLTVLYIIRWRREKDEQSIDTDSTSDLGSEMSDASRYTIDSTESQTLSEPYSAGPFSSGMSSESYHPRVPQPKKPVRGVISPGPYYRDMISPSLPSPPPFLSPPIAPPPPPRRAISPLPKSRTGISGRTMSNTYLQQSRSKYYSSQPRANYFSQQPVHVMPSDDLATAV